MASTAGGAMRDGAAGRDAGAGGLAGRLRPGRIIRAAGSIKSQSVRTEPPCSAKLYQRTRRAARHHGVIAGGVGSVAAVSLATGVDDGQGEAGGGDGSGCPAMS